MVNIKPKHRVLLLFAAAAAFLLWIGQPAPATTPVTDAAPAYETTTLTGEVMVLHSDSEDFTQADQMALLHTNDELVQLSDAASMQTYHGQTVNIVGRLTTAQGDAGLPTFDVELIKPLENDTQAGVTGNEKWVNVACRFSDMPDETPRPREYFEDIMVNVAPGMDHYWRQSSANNVDIAGSQAYGWYDLPRTKAAYLRMPTAIALRSLMQDCVNLAMEGDSVTFDQFGGINIMLNDTFGCCAWGGRMGVSIENGKSKTFRTTWLPPWAFNSLHVIAHEMGHGWGLPHSSGPYGKVYDSAWDVMSGGTRMMDVCRVGTDALGCFQVGTIGYHLDQLGWLPDERVETVAAGETKTFTLNALTTVTSSFDTLLVKVPVSQRSFYTVEVRHFTGYDRNIPGEAVVLHEVQTGRSSPALVVDADNNGNPNDEGAMWFPGETFDDDGIRVEVQRRVGSTFVVKVSNGN